MDLRAQTLFFFCKLACFTVNQLEDERTTGDDAGSSGQKVPERETKFNTHDSGTRIRPICQIKYYNKKKMKLKWTARSLALIKPTLTIAGGTKIISTLSSNILIPKW